MPKRMPRTCFRVKSYELQFQAIKMSLGTTVVVCKVKITGVEQCLVAIQLLEYLILVPASPLVMADLIVLAGHLLLAVLVSPRMVAS